MILLLECFSHQRLLVAFHWSLGDSKSSQVSRTFHSILTNLNNDVVWMISAHLPISNSSSPLVSFRGIVPSASITVGITVTFMFHSLFSSLARSKYLFLFSFSLIFMLWSADGEALVMLNFWWMQKIISMPSLQGPQFGRFSIYLSIYLSISTVSLLASIIFLICFFLSIVPRSTRKSRKETTRNQPEYLIILLKRWPYTPNNYKTGISPSSLVSYMWHPFFFLLRSYPSEVGTIDILNALLTGGIC